MTSVGISDGSVNHKPPKLYYLDANLDVDYRVKTQCGFLDTKHKSYH